MLPLVTLALALEWTQQHPPPGAGREGGQPPGAPRVYQIDPGGRGRQLERVPPGPQDPRSIRVVHKDGPPERRREPGVERDHLMLPVTLQVVRADGQTDELRPDLFPETEKLQFDAAAQCFRARVSVQLRAGSGTHDLAEPVTLLLRSNGSQAADPAQLRFTRTNTPLSVVLADSGLHDPVELGVMVMGDPDTGPPAGLELSLDRLTLELTVPERMLGFGLQQETIHVRSAAVLSAGSFPVDLSASKGRVEQGTVSLSGQNSGAATLRSTGLGTAQVTAAGAVFLPATASVQYVFPYLFLAAALLGGAAGALIQGLRRRGGKLRARELALGLASGVLAAVAYAAGVNLVGVEFGTHLHEAVVFTIGALAALLGLPALARLRGAAQTSD